MPSQCAKRRASRKEACEYLGDSLGIGHEYDDPKYAHRAPVACSARGGGDVSLLHAALCGLVCALPVCAGGAYGLG